MNQSSHQRFACASLLDTKRNKTMMTAKTSKVMMVASNLGVWSPLGTGPFGVDMSADSWTVVEYN